MKNFLLEDQQRAERLTRLAQFIDSNPEPRELKRALAVKLAIEGEPYSKISQLLGMQKPSITHWKHQFEAVGLAGLKLAYQGARSYLTVEQRGEIITWLKTKDYWDLDELVTYIDEQYGVIYKSKQSYYDLFSDANISWKKSQKINPKRDEDLVQKKREEIQDFLRQNQADIEAGRLVVLFVDECHL